MRWAVPLCCFWSAPLLLDGQVATDANAASLASEGVRSAVGVAEEALQELRQLEGEVQAQRQLDEQVLMEQRETRRTMEELQRSIRDQGNMVMRREVAEHHQEGGGGNGEKKKPCRDPENDAVVWHECKLPKTYSLHEQRSYIDCIGTVCQDVEGDYIRRVVNTSIADCASLLDYYKDCMVDLSTQSALVPPHTLLGHICNLKCPEMCRSFLQVGAAEQAAGEPEPRELPPLPGYLGEAPRSSSPASVHYPISAVPGARAWSADGLFRGDRPGSSPVAGYPIEQQVQEQQQQQQQQHQTGPRSLVPSPSEVAAEPVGWPQDAQSQYPVDEWRTEEAQRQTAEEASRQKDGSAAPDTVGGKVYHVELPPLPDALGADRVGSPPLPKGAGGQPPLQPLLQGQ